MKTEFVLIGMIGLLIIPFAYADSFDFCHGQTFNSNFWQDTICYESITCDVKPPLIFKESSLESFDFTITMVQPFGKCTDKEGNIISFILPESYTVKIIDSYFNYTVYDGTANTLNDLPPIILHKGIDYDIIIKSDWKTNNDDSKHKPYIEDDYGNLIDTIPPDYTLEYKGGL